MHNGRELYERRFARAFADFNDAQFCVPTNSGSAGLVIALRACGVGYGDEVVLPALTWVGCAAAVLAVGAVPVFADICARTLSISHRAARAAITDRTAAIMVVHPYCTIADLDEFIALAAETSLPLIEDCSQAHGSTWRGRRVGTFGAVGVFSMQESKVLTCGEGGAVITNDESLYRRLNQLRADGRSYTTLPPQWGRPELEAIGEIQGHNYCLSELHAAILVDRLPHLASELAWRETTARQLAALLQGIDGVMVAPRPQAASLISYWRFCARLDVAEFGGSSLEFICDALSAALRVSVKPVDPPIPDSPLYRPLRSALAKDSKAMRQRLDVARFDLPYARSARATYLQIPHRVLLAKEDDMSDIAEAVSKVQRAARMENPLRRHPSGVQRPSKM